MALKYVGGYRKDISEEPSEKPGAGIFSRLGTSFEGRLKKAKKMFDTLQQSKTSAFSPKGFAESASTGLGIVGQVAGSVGDVIGEGVISAGKAILSDDTEKSISDMAQNIGQSKPISWALSKWDTLEQESPFVASAVSGAGNIIGLTGTGAVGKVATAPLKRGAVSAVKSGVRGIERSAEIVAPAIKTASNVSGDILDSAGSHLLAMSPQTIKNIVSGKVSKEAMNKLDRVSLANKAQEGIDKAIDELSGLGEEYNGIRSLNTQVKIPVGGRFALKDNVLREVSKPITDALTEYGLLIDETGRITKNIDSKPFDASAINAIQEFIDVYGKSGDITPAQFLNIRKASDNIVDWNSKGADLANSFAKTLRQNYDNLGKEQIPGLSKLDAEFAPMVKDITQIKRDFLTPSGELKDTAYTTLANLSNKGREKTLARLEKYVPGITEEINILRAVEDIASASGIKVGTYTRGAVSGALFLTNPLAGALGFIVTHPSISVPILRAYGQTSRTISKTAKEILQKMSSGVKLNKKERDTFIRAVSTMLDLDNQNTKVQIERKSFSGLDADGLAKENAGYDLLDKNLKELIEKHKSLPDSYGGKLINSDDMRPIVWDENKFGKYKGTEAEKIARDN